MTRVARSRQTFECPHCGAQVRVGSKVCRECGSDDVTGWQSSEELDYQEIDIPDGYGPEQESLYAESRPNRLFVVAAVLVAIGMAIWALLRWR